MQINDEWWCGKNGVGGLCNIDCAKLVDSNIADDLKCGQTIVRETGAKAASGGDGFTAWPIYTDSCKANANNYIRDCGFTEGLMPIRPSTVVQAKVEPTKTELQPDGGIVFEVCDMARQLLDNNIPLEELDIWMCIIHRESNFNTSKVSIQHSDGSREHGLFQVSDTWWCSPPGNGTGCNIDCAKFKDTNITDDVTCALTIRNSREGFSAWESYNRWCKASRIAYSRSCDLVPSTALVPAFKPADGSVYELCNLAQELLFIHKIPKEEINTWVNTFLYLITRGLAQMPNTQKL